MSFDIRSTQAINLIVGCALEQGLRVSIAVVDSSGVLQGFHRMDGSLTGPVEIAQKKARTAALFGESSAEFGERAQPGGKIYSIEHTNGGLISFGGGIALRQGNRVVGGLGVSGATTEQDEELANVGLQAFLD